MKRVTQHEAVFYKLYKAYKSDAEQFIPIYAFTGDVYIEEIGMSAFLSHRADARVGEVYYDNPTLLERKEIIGQSGARYYAFRIAPNPSPSKIIDPKLLAFYRRISGAPILVPSGSTQRTYTVRALPLGGYSCDCDGFKYRKQCRHIDAAKRDSIAVH